jgi:hypothetical protein
MRKVIVGLTLLLGLTGCSCCSTDSVETNNEPFHRLSKKLKIFGEWKALEPDDLAPNVDDLKDPDAIRRLAVRLFDYPERQQDRESYPGRAGYFGCDELGHSRLLLALSRLEEEDDLDAQIFDLLAELSGPVGCPGEKESNFNVYYDGSRANAEIVACQLERARRLLKSLFLQDEPAPIESGGRRKSVLKFPAGPLLVRLEDLGTGTFGGTSRDGPIFINSVDVDRALASKPPEISKVLAWVTHEYFHKVQYEHGFRSKWRPVSYVGGGRVFMRPETAWLAEGTASWVEEKVELEAYRRGELAEMASPDGWKFELTHSKPLVSYYGRDYDALPFWRFVLDPTFHSHPDYLPGILSGPDSVPLGWAWAYPSFAPAQLEEDGKGVSSKSLLDDRRSYVRPYRVRVKCDEGFEWSWEHVGLIKPVSAAYYEFVGASESDIIQVNGAELDIKASRTSADPYAPSAMAYRRLAEKAVEEGVHLTVAFDLYTKSYKVVFKCGSRRQS